MPSNHLILCCPPSPPVLNLSQHQGLFQQVGSLHLVAKISEFQPQHQSFQWYSRFISFRIDWFDFLAVQGTLKSLLQHHSSKVSVLQLSAFFTVQHSHLYMTTGKTIALTIQIFVSKVMALLFNIQVYHNSFLSKEQASFNFISVVSICMGLFRGFQFCSIDLYICVSATTILFWLLWFVK